MSAQTLLRCSADARVSFIETWSHTYFMNVRVPHVWRHLQIFPILYSSHISRFCNVTFSFLCIWKYLLFFFATFSQFVPGLYSNESFLTKLFSFVNCLLISLLLSREWMHTLEIFFREKGEAKGFFHCCVFIFVWFSFSFFFFCFCLFGCLL